MVASSNTMEPKSSVTEAVMRMSFLFYTETRLLCEIDADFHFYYIIIHPNLHFVNEKPA